MLGKRRGRGFWVPFALLLVAFLAAGDAAQARAAAEVDQLGDLTLEDLLNLEVSSVSKKLEPIAETTAAVYVITSEDIRRSGHTSLPEALRLAPGVDVARGTSNGWSITIRGFNGQFANKLLVLIDGRSVYTPLFAGVFWELQDLPLSDIDRIEVIRGPGGTIWGANAVNGVINIITKRSEDTVGSSLTAGLGSEDRLVTSVRYGARSSDTLTWRVFGKQANRDSMIFKNHSAAGDEWRMGHAGFRADWQPGHRDRVSFQGTSYRGDQGVMVAVDDALNQALGIGTRRQEEVAFGLKGGDLRFGWTRTLAEDSSLEVAAYYDRNDRLSETHFEEHRATYDLAVQHRFGIANRHDVVWGGSYRLSNDRIESTPNLRFFDERGQNVVYSAFAQDDIALVPERVKLTLGSKVEWNDYTGWEIQPSVRALYAVAPDQQIWASVSRAARTPARINRDLDELLLAVVPAGVLGCPGTFAVSPACHFSIRGSDDYESEVVVAYELGYRVRPLPDVSLDLATFVNDYENLLAFSSRPPDPFNAFADNYSEGRAYGAEVALRWFASERLRLGMNHAYFKLQEPTVTGSGDEEQTPRHKWRGWVSLDLPHGAQLDTSLAYVGRVPFGDGPVDSYWRLDVSLGLQLSQHLGLRLTGQNLTQRRHAEFAPVLFQPVIEQVERSAYAELVWDF
jgi:iron complex outermembrane recepter protein